MDDMQPQLARTEPTPCLPSGQVMSLHTVLEQKADHERIVVAVKRLREKCSASTTDRLRDIEDRFMCVLYMQDLTPQQWYKTALGIVTDVLAQDFEDLAGTVNQILFVSSRFHFATAPQPENCATMRSVRRSQIP